MSHDEDWEQRQRYLLRCMFVQPPGLSPIGELRESSELSVTVDDWELIVERIPRRPDDDEPEEVYNQLERKIRKLWPTLANSKCSDDNSVKLDPQIYSYSDIATDHNMSDDVSQLEHESTDKETRDVDEEEMEEEIEDIHQEVDEEVEEEIVDEAEEDIDKEMDQKVHEDMIEDIGGEKDESNQENATNQSDLGSSDDTMHLIERQTLKRPQNCDNRDGDYLKITWSGSSSGDFDQRCGNIQDVGEEGSQSGDKQDSDDDRQNEELLSAEEREKNNEEESEDSNGRDDAVANQSAAIATSSSSEGRDNNEEEEKESQHSNKSNDDEDILNAAIPTAEERDEETEIENMGEGDKQVDKYGSESAPVIDQEDTEILDEPSSDDGDRLVIQEAEIEEMRSHNPSPAADSFPHEVERNSSTNTIQRSSLNVKQSSVGDHTISADFLVTPEEIIMSNESREEIHLLVTTPPPLRSSASKRAASHPASEASPPKSNVSVQNVRGTVDAEVQTEQKTTTTETQTVSTTPPPLRSGASKRATSDPASEEPPPKRNVSVQTVRETVDAGVQTEQKTRTTETQTDSEERYRFRSWGAYTSMYSGFWFN